MANYSKKRKNGYRKSKGQKDTKFTRRNEDERTSEEGKGRSEGSRMSSLNDISWYSKYPELLAAAASIPYPYRPGMILNASGEPMSFGNGTSAFSAPSNYAIGGVMQLNWAPSIGKSSTPTDPASVVGKEIYAKVRAAYSGALEVDAPDFVIYLLALDSVYSYIGALKRIYRILNAYTPYNHIIPRTLLQVMGFDDDSITNMQSHRTEMWGIINELIHMSRKFTCPAEMDLFNRHYWMNDNVYTDDATINSQFYIFRQNHYYIYQEKNTPDGVPASGLDYQVMNWIGKVDGSVPKNMFAFGRSLIDALVSWDDAYTINGYLQRAYSDIPSFTIDLLLQDEQFTPVYVPEVLSQIENSNAVGTAVLGVISNPISQDPKTNSVIANPEYIINGVNINRVGGLEDAPIFLSARSDSPTVADTVIMSRLKNSLDKGRRTVDTAVYYPIVAGTEVCLSWDITVPDWTLTSTTSTFKEWTVDQIPFDAFINFVTPQDTYGRTVMETALQPLLYKSAFDWSPIVPVYYYLAGYKGTGDTRASYSGMALVGDIHNVTQVSKEQLKEIHRVCLLSELNAYRF